MQVLHTPTRAPRRQDIPLFIRLGETPIGRTRNLSVTGIFVETKVRPEVGSIHDLWLAWDDSTFSCPVRIVRHAGDGLGLAFIEPDAFFLQAIREILAEGASAPPVLASV